MTDSILADDKAIAYGRCLTFPEYCQLQEDRGRLLQMRYAETRLAPARQDAMVGYGEMLYVVALVTDEDPDTIAVLPVVVRLTDASQRIQMRILSDEDLRLLTVLLPDLDMVAVLEEWDLPQLFVFDEEWELQAQWGPRPAQAERNLEEWMGRYPEYETLAEDETAEAQERYASLMTALTYEMRVWYNSSLADACQHEFCEILVGLLPQDE